LCYFVRKRSQSNKGELHSEERKRKSARNQERGDGKAKGKNKKNHKKLTEKSRKLSLNLAPVGEESSMKAG
jgi:hypothetical protein